MITCYAHGLKRMTYHIYILRCFDGSFYTGVTNDLERRVEEHNAGVGGKYTLRRRPVQLVFSEQFMSVEEAIRAEKRIKGWSHGKKEALVMGDFKLLHDLAECRNQSHHKCR